MRRWVGEGGSVRREGGTQTESAGEKGRMVLFCNKSHRLCL